MMAPGVPAATSLVPLSKINVMYNAAIFSIAHLGEIMETHSGDPIASEELGNDLKAAVRARRELDPDMEDQVLEAFLARIDHRVQQQITQQVAAAKPAKQRARYNPTEIVGTTFGTAIPLMIIAAIFAHTAGVIAVAVLVLAVNLLYYLDNRW